MLYCAFEPCTLSFYAAVVCRERKKHIRVGVRRRVMVGEDRHL
jgi:hypothetical protein